jgi:hypothetical protein
MELKREKQKREKARIFLEIGNLDLKERTCGAKKR